jgi:hypothetical protein
MQSIGKEVTRVFRKGNPFRSRGNVDYKTNTMLVHHIPKDVTTEQVKEMIVQHTHILPWNVFVIPSSNDLGLAPPNVLG